MKMRLQRFAVFANKCAISQEQLIQPVYGINDWYFAYGNNSADLILQHTSLLAPLATNTSNKPFSVIDMGWATGTDYSTPNEKFGDMQQACRQN